MFAFLTLIGEYITNAELNRVMMVQGMEDLRAYGESVTKLHEILTLEMLYRGISVNSYGLRPNAFA